MRRKERPGPGKAEEKSIPFASLDGSWEKATEELRMDLKQYLVGMGISVLDGDWICIVGTYEDHVIACVEKSGTGRQEYYRIDWTKVDGKPSFCGEPKLVEVEVTTEIIEKMKSLQNQAAYQPEGQKPYPNEHALRLNDPDKYDKIRRQNDKFEDGIHAIFGILEGKTELQSIRFSADKFTSEEALKWLEEHDYKTSGFEPAKKVEKQLVDDATSGGTAAAPPVQDFGGKKKMVCPECGYVGPGVDGKCPECGAKLVPKKKGFNSEKRGRVLNKANEKKIRDAVDDLEEASKMDGVPRGCKALIRQAKRSLGDVVSSLGGDGEVVEEKTEAGVSAKQAMAILLATGGEAERKVMASMLKAIEDGHQADEVVEQYAEIFG